MSYLSYAAAPPATAVEDDVFIFSDAGKPIYSLRTPISHCLEITGLLQALLSRSHHFGDSIQYYFRRSSPCARDLSSTDRRLQILEKGPLIFVFLSPRRGRSRIYCQLLLDYLYCQIIFYSTTQCISYLEANPNQDFRRYLGKGTESLTSMLDHSGRTWSYFVRGYHILPFPVAKRRSLIQILQRHKHPSILYSFLCTNRQYTVTLVENSHYPLHPTDVILLESLLLSSQVQEDTEMWLPLSFHSVSDDGFIHLYSGVESLVPRSCRYLASVSKDVYLTVISVDQSAEGFQVCSSYRKSVQSEISDVLYRAVRFFNDQGEYRVTELNLPGLYHFIYRTPSGQYTCPRREGGYRGDCGRQKLLSMYLEGLDSMLKSESTLYLNTRELESVYIERQKQYELYVVSSPLMTMKEIYLMVQHILIWINRNGQNHFLNPIPHWK